MPALEQLGLQTAGQAIGAGMGLLLGNINDKRQIKQQQKLQDMQIAGQKQMAEYNYGKQMQMWKATNYDAQKTEMEKAGLNPGLMYGMSGGGGTTTGSPSGNVSGGTAPTGGGEASAMAGMGLQSAMNVRLMKAQAENIEADTANKKAEAAYKGGPQTDLTAQQADNARWTQELQKVDLTMKHIENFEKQASQQDRLSYITTQAKTAVEQLTEAKQNAKMSQEAYDSKLNQIKQESIGAVIKNTLTQSQINATEAQIKKLSADIAQGWKGLEIGNARYELEKWAQEIKANFPGFGQVTGRLLNDIMEAMHQLTHGSQNPQHYKMK